MYKIKLVLIISIQILLSFDLSAQTTNPNCKWVGTVSASFSNPNIPQRNEILTGNIVFEYDHGGELGSPEVYKLTGGRMNWSLAGGTMQNDCTVKSNSVSFSWDSVQVFGGELVINENGSYYGSAANQDLALNFTAVHTDCENYSSDEPPIVYAIAVGNQEDTSFIQDDAMSGSFTQSLWTWNWNLHKESGEEVKLEVESGIYDGWLPSAGKNEDEYGELIPFYAKLVEPDGSTACEKAKKFVFQLTNVSKEPGVALNFPEASKAKDDYDIHFLQEFIGPDDVMSTDKLSVETKGGSESFAVVLPFDWGGWATLKVTAVMQNDDTLTGYLSGHPEITEIPIPKRSGDSKTADKWKQDSGVASYNDDDDNESVPKGDGDEGDGFTLYEEYRGFYQKGRHISGDPKKKDLFIYTKVEKFKPGIQLFKTITKLNVHYHLNSSEFDTTNRLINFNYSNGPHKTPQHGLFVIQINGSKSLSSLGPPGNVNRVMITQIDRFASIRVGRGGRGREITNYLNSTVAHELGHAVRIDHHGDGDKKYCSWQTTYIYNQNTDMASPQFTEEGVKVDARWEYGRHYTDPISDDVYVAAWGGEHSGFSDCVMRYDCAFAYIPGPGTASNIRYIIHQNERTGLFLCDKQEDPGGVNDLNRIPRPRYGKAERGKCMEQICVNDKYH